MQTLEIFSVISEPAILGGGGGAGGARGGYGPTTFCVAKIKKGNKEKKERLSKQKLWKGCHQGQNVTVLVILEPLEFNKFLVGQPWWSTILVSVPWPLHFEIYFTGPGFNDLH